MNCRICDTDLTGLDIEYHFSKNHMTEPDARDYILGYRDAGSMIASLREENARLTRERDEAREKLAALETDYAEAQDIAVSESAGRRAAEAEVVRSHDAILHLTREVARLEGLILDWEVYRPGRGDCINNLLVEARRIRAQREGK